MAPPSPRIHGLSRQHTDRRAKKKKRWAGRRGRELAALRCRDTLAGITACRCVCAQLFVALCSCSQLQTSSTPPPHRPVLDLHQRPFPFCRGPEFNTHRFLFLSLERPSHPIPCHHGGRIFDATLPGKPPSQRYACLHTPHPDGSFALSAL